MVSLMTMMALGFTAICATLSFNFYRKYKARLRVSAHIHQYARVADYNGVPLPLVFEYRSEESQAWIKVEVDVYEIYHYGADYFLRGYGIPDRKGRIFKWNRVANLSFRSNGRSLSSVDALLGEVCGREIRMAVNA